MSLSFLRFTAFVFLLSTIGGPSSALACSCSNSIPVQKAHKYYKKQAIFTAHVIQLMGKTHLEQGKRYSRLALAVVRERFWGLPWYWPPIVVLDGGSACNIELEDGEDYFVEGDPIGYGAFDVSGCSRTQPLRMAQVDLRTLDASRCTAPGGTLIGMLLAHYPDENPRPLYSNQTVRLTDSAGKRYSTITDAQGIFEFLHLPPGEYAFEPTATDSHFTNGFRMQVKDRTCIDASHTLHSYRIRGHITGLKPSEDVSVELIPISVRGTTSLHTHARLRADDTFYFDEVPPGDYLLGANISYGPNSGSPFPPTYYPGTTDRRKAELITIGKDPFLRLFDLPVKRLPQ